MVLPVVSVTDVGCMVEELFHQYVSKPTSAAYINKTVSVCAQHLSLTHMVSTLNTVLAPRKFRENQVTFSLLHS